MGVDLGVVAVVGDHRRCWWVGEAVVVGCRLLGGGEARAVRWMMGEAVVVVRCLLVTAAGVVRCLLVRVVEVARSSLVVEVVEVRRLSVRVVGEVPRWEVEEARVVRRKTAMGEARVLWSADPEAVVNSEAVRGVPIRRAL